MGIALGNEEPTFTGLAPGDGGPLDERGVLLTLMEQVASAPTTLPKLLERAELPLLAYDEDGRILGANRKAEHLFGHQSGALVGRSVLDLVAPRLRQSGGAKQVPIADVVRVQLPGVRLDGSERMLEWLYGSVQLASGPLFLLAVQDVREKGQADELAQRLAVERARRDAAEAAERRTRASEDRVRRLQRVTAALSEAATPLAVASVVLDQAMQATDARGAAVYVVSEDRTAIEMLDQRGHPDEPLSQYARMPVDAQAPMTDAVRLRRPLFFESFEACAAAYPGLREVIRSGNFEAAVALPLIAHGAVLGALGLRFEDARGFSEAERELMLTLAKLCAQALDRARLFAAEQLARERAEAANRAKDEFIAVLGHELRNPLAPIVTVLGLLELRGVPMERERKIIARQVRHLTRLVDDLLDVSRISQGKVVLRRERVEVAAVVAQAVEQVSPLLAQRRHQLTLRIPERGLAVNGDPVRLAQVVGNLLTNAAKYTPAKGHIEVRAERSGAMVQLTVRDDGIGIPASTLPRVFDLFVQDAGVLERAQGGLGLGLALVRSLVTRHGGSVSADSAGPGSGTTMTVRLPLAPEVADEQPGQGEPPRPASAAAGKGRDTPRRVLVVDDNVESADLMAEVATELGHEARVAYDGDQALALVSSFEPDIAVLDIGLPGMNGYELARRLSEALPRVRLVALTGYGQAGDVQRAAATGFARHVIKPVDFDTLREVLSEG